MDFKSGKKSISGLFSCKKQFVIPRFQREYTWDKIELNEFLDDILSRIHINDSKLDTSEYFWGSLLLVGDLDDQKELSVEVVDGQQRITTMTIFLSVISKLFAKEKQEGLSNALWEYIIGKDANTNPFAILKNETPKPFFQFIIQKLVEEKIEPKNTEEEKILKANKFFKNNLSKTGLIKRLKRLRKDDCCDFEYVELLKVIRDQLLRSFVICITTTDTEYANMIFEILNAKGKELASVDLIKNAIFEKLDNEVPADTAKETWLQIRNNLCSRALRVEFASFYRHFWISHYGKVQDNKLYSDFQKKVPKNEESYLSFLKEIEGASKRYAIILKPNLEDFSNKKEYAFVIEELASINNVFSIVQARPVFLSLLYMHLEKKVLTYKMFKKIIKGLSCFHFAYNAICSKRTSSLESPLNTFAYNMFHAENNNEIRDIVKELKQSLIGLLPTEEEFVENFTTLKYSKKNIPSNVLTKYTINKWQCILDGSDTKLPDSSIEHIKDEVANDEETCLIGNLILLEQRINSGIPANSSFEEKLVYYNDSKYSMVHNFINESSEKTSWAEDDIFRRGQSWAKEYYAKIVALINEIV